MQLFLILLAGGKGLRFGSDLPKQFLPLRDKPVALHSFETLSGIEAIQGICVVTPPEFQHLFPDSPKLVSFANPGNRRQDSVFSGLSKLPENADWILIHDAARPFVKKEDVESLIEKTPPASAGTLGLLVTSTIKEVDSSGFVVKTHPRSHLREIQTPQLIKKDILQKGMEKCLNEEITVTDDVSLAELIGEPVKVIEGSSDNIKITYPKDLYANLSP